MKSTFKSLSSLVPSNISTKTLSSDEIICSEASKFRHDYVFDELNGIGNPPLYDNEGLSLLPNRTNRETLHHLHLIVHGSKGG